MGKKQIKSFQIIWKSDIIFIKSNLDMYNSKQTKNTSKSRYVFLVCLSMLLLLPVWSGHVISSCLINCIFVFTVYHTSLCTCRN